MLISDVIIEVPQLHSGQQRIVSGLARNTVVRCGRRFGKSTLGVEMCCKGLIHDFPVGYFGPTYKLIAPQQDLLMGILQEPYAKPNRSEKFILKSGPPPRRPNDPVGRIDFWSCERPDPGRGRKYKLVIIDEAGLIRNFDQVWQGAIKPTLADYQGNAVFLGTPKGSQGLFNTLFKRGEQRQPGWASFQMGTIDNPYIDPQEIEDARKELPPDIFAQEYEGEPADDGGNPFGLDAIRECYKPSMFVEDPKPIAFGVDLASKYDYTWIIGCNKAGQVVVSERFQLDWGETKDRIIKTCGNYPTLVDSTGVGDPVVEDLVKVAGCSFEGFKFSNSSKQQIMIGLRNDIQTRSVEFADEELKLELEAFGYEFKENKVTYSAPEGLHDDGVCAFALCRQHVRTGPLHRAVEPGDLVTLKRKVRY